MRTVLNLLNYSARKHVLEKMRNDDIEMRRLIRKLVDLQLNGRRAFVPSALETLGHGRVQGPRRLPRRSGMHR